jgi:hypothetical protein
MTEQNTYEGWQDILNKIRGTVPLSTSKMGLFTNALAPGFHTKLTDLVQPTFTSYALTTANLNQTPIIHGDETAEVIGGGVATFQGTVPADFPVTIQGVFLTDTGGTELLGAAILDTPVVLASIADAIVFLAFISLDDTGKLSVGFELVS